ncbi:MAG: ATP-binding cassette domain-containing protein [Defluviitaleaceae bacterium]|nr:ATP-binding cassette domain-containing protein [Defluviitaleaceae bacterium]
MKPVIETQGLKKYFPTAYGMLHAVDDVTITIEKGRTLGVVGESGCGKSTLGRTIIHLLERTDGKIFLHGEDISDVSGKQLRAAREKMQIVFQDPYSSIDPRKTIEYTIKEPLAVSKRYKRREIDELTTELMELVGIDNRLRLSYPHELDGGRRQRVGIARALALQPDFIVCDEPVSALDVSIQAQVLNLLKRLQQQRGLAYMFVTHDLSVVRHISDDICVMYLGQVVELCPSKELFKNPLHPYTKALLSAIPSIDIHNPSTPEILEGELSSPINPKPGCRFIPRCKYATDECHQPQEQTEVSPGHFVRCCRLGQI